MDFYETWKKEEDLRIRFQIKGFFNVVRLKFSVDSLDNSWQKIRGTPCKEVGMGMVKPWQRYAFSECLLVAVMITFSLKWSIVVLVLLGISECHNWQVLIIAKTLNELKWITAIFCDWLIHSFIYWKNTSRIWLPEKRGQQLISLEPLISCCCSAFLWTCMWIFHPINLFFSLMYTIR